MDAAVEFAFTPVLPKKACRCDRPGWPGKTIGSSNAMCDSSQTVRKAPVPSELPGNSVVAPSWSEAKPLNPVGILELSIAGTELVIDDVSGGEGDGAGAGAGSDIVPGAGA